MPLELENCTNNVSRTSIINSNKIMDLSTKITQIQKRKKCFFLLVLLPLLVLLSLLTSYKSKPQFYKTSLDQKTLLKTPEFVESKIGISPISKNPLPKIAYLISGSRGDGESLKRTLKAVYHPWNEYVVHLDLEAPPDERLDLIDFVEKESVFREVGNVRVMAKSNLVTYRGPTMVSNTLHGMAILLKEGGTWDRYINLSASDYPLVTQDDGLSRKAAVSWSQMILPFSKGGLNIRDMYLWNKAAILKHIWNLENMKENLWVKWVHSFYLKNQRIQDVNPSIHASWIFKKIVKHSELVGKLGGWQNITKGSAYRIGKGYDLLIAEYPRVSWGSIMIKNIASPSAKFITWLAIQNRLATKDRIGKWVNLTDDNCVMCSGSKESSQHLLFECSYAREIRARLFRFLPQPLNEPSFPEEIQKMSKLNSKKTNKAKLIVGLWTEMIYSIWMQRNTKIFDNHILGMKEIIDCIVFRIASRARSRMIDMLVSR